MSGSSGVVKSNTNVMLQNPSSSPPAFALLLVVGISRWFAVRWSRGVAIAVGVGACGLALYALCGVLQPAFARPRELNEREVAAAPNPVTTEFGGVARVLGFVVTPTTVEPGDAVWVTVYWQALARTDRDYAVFVHLLSDVGTMVAQRDTYPGLGSAPTTAWDPGVVFVDRYRVDVPESALRARRGIHPGRHVR